MKIRIACAFALAAGLAANADEVWSTPIGDVVYESDAGDIAILSYPLDQDGLRGHAFISGLGGNYDDRGHFTGYWSEAQTEEPLCDLTIVDGNGLESPNWGRLTITFLDSGFPSGWVAVRGDCFDEPSRPLVANPVVAPGVR